MHDIVSDEENPNTTACPPEVRRQHLQGQSCWTLTLFAARVHGSALWDKHLAFVMWLTTQLPLGPAIPLLAIPLLTREKHQHLSKKKKRERDYYSLFRAAPTAHGSSQARDGIGAVAASLCHSHSNVGSDPCLDPHHSSWQCRILNPLARDRTRVFLDTLGSLLLSHNGIKTFKAALFRRVKDWRHPGCPSTGE